MENAEFEKLDRILKTVIKEEAQKELTPEQRKIADEMSKF